MILFKNLIIFLDFINIIFAFAIVVSLNSLIIQNLNIKRKRFFVAHELDIKHRRAAHELEIKQGKRKPKL